MTQYICNYMCGLFFLISIHVESNVIPWHPCTGFESSEWVLFSHQWETVL